MTAVNSFEAHLASSGAWRAALPVELVGPGETS
jgi:hypothetical protein